MKIGTVRRNLLTWIYSTCHSCWVIDGPCFGSSAGSFLCSDGEKRTTTMCMVQVFQSFECRRLVVDQMCPQFRLSKNRSVLSVEKSMYYFSECDDRLRQSIRRKIDAKHILCFCAEQKNMLLGTSCVLCWHDIPLSSLPTPSLQTKVSHSEKTRYDFQSFLNFSPSWVRHVPPSSVGQGHRPSFISTIWMVCRPPFVSSICMVCRPIIIGIYQSRNNSTQQNNTTTTSFLPLRPTRFWCLLGNPILPCGHHIFAFTGHHNFAFGPTQFWSKFWAISINSISHLLLWELTIQDWLSPYFVSSCSKELSNTDWCSWWEILLSVQLVYRLNFIIIVSLMLDPRYSSNLVATLNVGMSSERLWLECRSSEGLLLWNLRIDVMRCKGERSTAFAPKDNYRYRLTSKGDCYFGSSNPIRWVFLPLLHCDCEDVWDRLSLTNDAVRSNVDAALSRLRKLRHTIWYFLTTAPDDWLLIQAFDFFGVRWRYVLNSSLGLFGIFVVGYSCGKCFKPCGMVGRNIIMSNGPYARQFPLVRLEM